MVVLEGYEALQARLDMVGPTIRRRLFKSAVKPALSQMQSAARSNVRGLSVANPSNRVRKSIASKIRVNLPRGGKFSVVGKLGVFYGKSAKERGREDYATLSHLIEYGFTLTHYFGKRVKSKRIAAKPFMTPAFEANKGAAEAAFIAAVEEGCEELGI